MQQLTLAVHTIVSYTFAGVILAFLLSLLIIRGGRFHDPVLRIRLMSLNLLLPLASYLFLNYYSSSSKLHIPWLENTFWFLCQLGNWASLFTVPIVVTTACLVIFHFYCAFRSHFRYSRLPQIPPSFRNVVENITIKLAAEMKIKRPKLLFWPGDDVRAFTVGLYKPHVVISSGILQSLSEEELEWVLAHEFAHIKHKDSLKLLLLELLKDVLFFMPLVYWIGKIIACEVEKAADLAASKPNRVQYAATLLRIYRLQTGKEKFLGVLQPSFHGGKFASRIKNVLYPPKQSSWCLSLSVMGVISISVIYFLSWVC